MLDPVTTFQSLRPRLFGLAYHMLGSVSDAEDVMQDAYMRWHGVDHASVRHPRAFLMRAVTHLCMDATALAYRKRTDYIGEWLPDPLIHRDHDAVEREEALSLAMIRLLEALTPPERAVFVLRELFEYPYREISDFIGKPEAACRQLARRARLKLQRDPARSPADATVHEQWLWRFVQAVREGEPGALMHCLVEDAVLYSDGGGKAKAALNPVAGRERIARFLLGVVAKADASLTVQPLTINGTLGLQVLSDDAPTQIVTFDISSEGIREVQLMANPDKLAAIWGRRP